MAASDKKCPGAPGRLNRSGIACERITRLVHTPRVSVLEHRCSEAAPLQALPPPNVFSWPALGFVRRGLAMIEIAGRRIYADPTQLVIFGAETAYRVSHVGCGEGACAVTLHFCPEPTPHLFGEPRPNHLAPRTDAPIWLQRTPAMNASLNRIVVLSRDGENKHRILALCQSLLDDARNRIGAGGATSFVPPPATVLRLKELFASEYVRSPGLERLAEIAGVSKYHLCRSFRRETGMTVSEYRMRLRIGEAMAQAAGSASFARLSQELGFSSQSHFGAAFRKHTGLTPSAFRAWLLTESGPSR